MPRSSGVVAAALSASRLLAGPEADAGLRLLRLDQAAIAVAVLGSHLGGQKRRMSVADLHELIDEDLISLREAGMDLGEKTTARTYCDRWRAEGILVRSTAPGEREESYELSAPAEAALRYLSQVERPRAAVTQSRLASIASQLDRLVRDSDPSMERRLAGLRAERDAIDTQIARIEAGQSEPLDPHDGAERLEEIIALAEQIPGDFARVRSEMAELNRSLRERIVEAPGSRGEVLDDVFRGVDRIESSEAGRSFLARGLSPLPEAARIPREAEEAEFVPTWFRFDDVVDAVLAGRLHNPSTVMGVLAADRARARGWEGLRPVGARWLRSPRSL